MVGCKGLYAEIDFVKSTSREQSNDSLATLIKEYEKYKRSQIDSFEIVYDDGFQIVPKPYQPLRVVQIYFDTATYDEIERDKKIKFEAQLSLIGGTMGHLTGFSIISGIELVFFLIKLIASFRITKDDIVSATQKKFQNHLTLK